MFEKFLENMDNSEELDMKSKNMLDEELDSLLDEELDCNKKIDPAEKESPKDEALIFNYKGEVAEFDPVQVAKSFMKEDFEGDFSAFNNKDNLKKFGMMEFTDDCIKEKSLQQFLDESIILSEKASYKFDKSLAESNVKKLLEKKNEKMKKKGFLPLTSVNADLKKTVSELKSKSGMTGVKTTKISGVVCIQYNFDKKAVGYVGVCYYNKETHKIRVFDVKASVKLNEDIELLNEATLESIIILKPSDVDIKASKIVIENAKETKNNLIDSGKWREYKSSDASLVKKSLKSKYGKYILASTLITGLTLGASAGAGIGASIGSSRDSRNLKNNITSSTNDILSKINNNDFDENIFDQIDKEYKRVSIEHDEKLKQHKEWLKQQQKLHPEVFESLKKDAQKELKKKFSVVGKNNLDDTLSEDILINNESVNIFNEKIVDHTGFYSIIGGVAGGALGSAGGVLSGKKLVDYVVNNMNYSIFKLNDLTILSVYVTREVYSNTCYSIVTSIDGKKLKLTRINLVSKKNK